MRSSVDFWYRRISRRATVPGLYLWGFLTPPVDGALLLFYSQSLSQFILKMIGIPSGLTGELLARRFASCRLWYYVSMVSTMKYTINLLLAVCLVLAIVNGLDEDVSKVEMWLYGSRDLVEVGGGCVDGEEEGLDKEEEAR